MARLPLTVYLPRVELAKLEALARGAGMARSAFAGEAIRAKLVNITSAQTSVDDQLNFLSAAVEELISHQPNAEAIRSRLADHFAQPNQPGNERNIQCQNL